MANSDYIAKAIIETKQSQQDLTALGQAARSAGTSFAVLDKQLKGSNTSLKDAAAALKSVVESTRQGAIAAKALADAELKQARASGTAARNADAHALSQQRQATSAAQAALAEGRLTTSLEANARAAQRATEATQRHAAGQDRAAASSARRAQAEQRAAAASLEVTDHLSNSRYLLYDVASTYQMLAGALLAIPTATTAVAIAYERDMAQVVRTNDAIWGSSDAIDAMKGGLKDLASEIPVSFSELANIASIGGQLGIASSEMLKFTETVAKFGAASNVTTEAAATAFGRLQNAFPDDAKAADFFEKIGSAIAYVGVKSVATESEIIAVVNQLSPLAAQAGFTSDQVVALSGALASVRVRPELARGAFLATMTKMTTAAQEGATAFETYAKYLGMSGAQGKELFESDPGEFFNQFIQGMAGAIEGGQAFSTVMSDLGVKEKRETQFLLALANGSEVAADAFKNASSAYKEGTFLDDSTARVFSTVSAELTKLANNFKNLGDTLGGGSMNLFAEFLRLVSGAVKGISDLASENKAVLIFINGLLGIGAVIGVLLAFKAAQAAALAAVVAYRQVVGSAITSSISFSGVLKELTTTMLMARGATLADAQAHVARNGVLRSTVASQAQVSAGNVAMAASTTATTGRVAAMAGGLRSAGSSMLGLVGGPVGALITGLALVGAGFFAAGAEAKAAGKLIAEGMAAGGDTATKAIAEQLTGKTVKWNENPTFFGDMGKNVRQLAKDVDIDFNSIVNSIKKGENAGNDFSKTLDAWAQKQGSANYDEWSKRFDVDPAVAARIGYLKSTVESMGKNAAESGKDIDAVTGAVKGAGDSASGATPAMDEFGDGMDGAGASAEDATQKITGFIDALFAMVNAEGATQASLEKLGAGLQDSTQFNPMSGEGRDNLANLQETLRNAALLEQQMIDAGQQSAQQAQANYVAFIDGLYAELASRGVDPAEIQAQVDAAKNIFNSAVADENANNTAALKVGVEVDEPAVAEAKNYIDQIRNEFGTVDVKVLAEAVGMEGVVDNILAMDNVIQSVTGESYVATVQADTSNANENATLTGNFISDIVAAIYMMSIGADITPATSALQTLAQFAANVVNSISNQINRLASVAGRVPGMGWAKNIDLPQVGWGQAAPVAPAAAVQKQTAPRPTAPAQVAPKATANPTAGIAKGLDGVAKGYNDAAKAADKAGGAGKDAGKDMADGIEDAKKSLDDYVSRLKSGLTDAYNQQYGMAEATDNYYKALNAITDKRKEDLDAIEDLIQAQKELNNERDKDLVDARKAGIEKNISIKYGETDRAADYANQEQTALDNAAAKQKDIEANKANQASLIEGMNALTGYTNAAISNRAALRDVESKMLDMIVAYAATGASQEQVAAYAASLTGKFQQQTGAIGYNQAQLSGLQGEVWRYIGAVNSVPRYVATTAHAETAGATGAANNLRNAINSIPAYKSSTVDLRVNSKTVYTDEDYRRVNDQRSRGHALPFAEGGQIPGFSNGGQVPGTAPADLSKDNRLAKVDGKGIVGIQSEEWVIKKAAVDFYGNDFMDDINNMRMPKFAMGGTPSGYSGSGQAGGDMIVALDADTMAKFAQFMDNPTYLFADAEVLASTVHKGGEVLASKGVRN